MITLFPFSEEDVACRSVQPQQQQLVFVYTCKRDDPIDSGRQWLWWRWMSLFEQLLLPKLYSEM